MLLLNIFIRRNAHVRTILVTRRRFRTLGTLRRAFRFMRSARDRPKTFNEFSLQCFCVNIDARVRRNANAPSIPVRNKTHIHKKLIASGTLCSPFELGLIHKSSYSHGDSDVVGDFFLKIGKKAGNSRSAHS